MVCVIVAAAAIAKVSADVMDRSFIFAGVPPVRLAVLLLDVVDLFLETFTAVEDSSRSAPPRALALEQK